MERDDGATTSGGAAAAAATHCAALRWNAAQLRTRPPAHNILSHTLHQLTTTKHSDPLEEQLEFDLGNLAAFDPSPVDAAAFAPARRSAACLEAAAAMAQALVSKLFSLPSEPVTGGRLARLPPPATPLPREKPLPKAKPMTKWQQFAQKKGIVKRKRSKLAWDDDANEWKRRHGYKKANDDAAVPIIEAKPGDEVGDDPFTRLRQEKRERVKKNQQQQLANLKGATKGGARLPPPLRLAAALPEKGRGKPVKRKELKDEVRC